MAATVRQKSVKISMASVGMVSNDGQEWLGKLQTMLKPMVRNKIISAC